MIDTDARIQINRDALKKIVKLTAESKADKKLITEMMELIEAYRGPYTYVKDSDGFNVSCKEVDELIQRAKKTTGV